MAGGNVKMALSSIKSAKWRSLLTMLGVIIGVVSVVTTVSLGEGVRQQVVRQINQRGDDLITILPGKRVERDASGNISSFNPVVTDHGILVEGDYRAIQKAKGVQLAVPFSGITGIAQTGTKEFATGQVIATTEGMPAILNQKVEFGSFFGAKDNDKDVAIIGRRVAEQLFGENVPIGKSFKIRGHSFIVQGIFEEFEGSSAAISRLDYNSAIFIPFDTGKRLMSGNSQIYQVLAKPAKETPVKEVVAAINQALLSNHSGQQDFTVLQQAETLALANQILSLLTGLIAGIAAISLVVGGIGIMNIMLVSVTERTHEIGVRKAVGATNQQILRQFLTEAMVLSLLGGLIGILLSILTNFILRIFTDLQPVITLPIILVASAVALVVGVIFGITPAMRAARKDPIEALRYE